MKINQFSFREIHLKMSSVYWWPFYLGLNVLPLLWCLQSGRGPIMLNRHNALKCQYVPTYPWNLRHIWIKGLLRKYYHDELIFYINIYEVKLTIFSCDQAALWMVFSIRPSVRLSHLLEYVPIIVSSWNFQKLSLRTRVRSMQKAKVRGQRSRSQRSQPNLAVSGL